MSHSSLKEVAERAQVSISTAGKVLQGKGTVSPKTRATILQVAETLGYVPNAVARSLVSKKTATIGVVMSDFSDVALSQIFVGTSKEVNRQELSIMVGDVDLTGERRMSQLRTLLERRVDGIVLIAPHLESEAWLIDMLRDRLPVVSTHPFLEKSFSMVHANDVLIGSTATQHLITLGHSNIGMITGVASRFVTQERLLGYRQALEAANIAYHPEWVEEGDWQIMGGYNATCTLLERAPDLTAIYAQNDTMAVGILSALRDLGRRVPEDCAIVGCDDIPLAAHLFPSLSTMHIPFFDIGQLAVQLLLDLITQRITEPKQIVLPTHLIPRSSSTS